MYAYVDQPVERLCMGGRFLLWAMRGWSQAVESGRCPPIALSAGFSAVGGLAAMRDFHMAMTLFNQDALGQISVAPMECPYIVEDEAIVLGMWRDVALGDFANMRATLALTVARESISPLAQAMTTVLARLVASGFDMTGLTREILKEEK